MKIPPNMGKRYTDEFRNMYPELAKRNDVRLIPFLLEGVGGEARLNLEDGIHPTAEGHTILAQNVWSVLEPML
jgi:acyl-CoA thioesterase-1